jgi:hypothetical protein
MATETGTSRTLSGPMLIVGVICIGVGVAIGAITVSHKSVSQPEVQAPSPVGWTGQGDVLPEPPALASNSASPPPEPPEALPPTAVSEPAEAPTPAPTPLEVAPFAEPPLPPTPAPAVESETEIPAPTPAAESDAEVLTYGPLHEALAETISFAPPAEAEIVESEEPPPAIEEVMPDDKPAGQDVVWIPGYWSWDDDRRSHIWVSGIWRRPPQNCRWVPGCWMRAAVGHYRWVSGFWMVSTGQPIQYLPAPPDSLEAGPLSPSPGSECIWMPGYWERVGLR